MAHFAFYPQRELLDEERVLERYGEYLRKEWSGDAVLRNIDSIVQAAVNEAEAKAEPAPEIHSVSPIKRIFDSITGKKKKRRKKNRKKSEIEDSSMRILD
jgi:hypothetical protein